MREVLYALGELRNEVILSPSPAIPTKILHSPRWNSYFKVSFIPGQFLITIVVRFLKYLLIL